MTQTQKNKILQAIKKEIYENLKYEKEDLTIKKIHRPTNKKSISKYLIIEFQDKNINNFEIRLSDHQRSFRQEANFNYVINDIREWQALKRVLDFEPYNFWMYLNRKIENLIYVVEEHIKEHLEDMKK